MGFMESVITSYWFLQSQLPIFADWNFYVPFKFDDKGEAIKSFSVGYAVADSVIDEPYFYVTQWKKDEKVDYSNVPELEYGEWLPEKLKGAGLALSDMLEMDNQESGIRDFIEKTVGFSKTWVRNSQKP